MKLIKLAPEAMRLRRMSRAYATGDISQSEYRAARRDIIARFESQVPGRSLIDETQRRQRVVVANTHGAGVLRGTSNLFWWFVGCAFVSGLIVALMALRGVGLF